MPTIVEKSRSHVRGDGPAKVTGTAPFAAEVLPDQCVHASVVTSAIARGRILGFDLTHAQKSNGLLRIFTYQEMSSGIRQVNHLMAGGYTNSSALPLGSPEVFYAGQIVALVVAETKEAADEAAQLIQVRYEEDPACGLLGQPGSEAVALASIRPSHKDPRIGDAQQAFQTAAITVDAIYSTPVQHHNPIELFGTTCVWSGDRLTVYEATRYLGAAQHGLAEQLGIDAGNIRVLCPYMGGHFGSRLALSQYTAPVAIAARLLGRRPVKFLATRSQGFTIANHRPDTRHHVRIGAMQDGQFTSLLHDAEFTSSRFDNFAMEGTDVTGSLYAWRNVETKETLVRVDRNTPGPMRAPPEVPYLFAIESAVDELAERLRMDPIELRRKNDTAVDPISGKPFTPRRLMNCFDAGAAAFGWSTCNSRMQPRRQGDWLIGYGCATSVRPIKRAAAMMRVALAASGRATVETAHHEIGNGIYTVLAMEASARLGVPITAITVRLGDTALPPASISGGSSTTTSLVPVLASGCETLRERLAHAAIAGNSLFASLGPNDLILKAGDLVAPNGDGMKLADVFALLGTKEIATVAQGVPDGAGEEAIAKLRQGKLTLGNAENSLRWACGAQFAEVHIHSLTSEIRVPRLLGAFSAGYIIDRLTALSQLRGGMIWGIGAALLEESVLDPRTPRYVNDNLAEYLVPTQADTGSVDAILLDADSDPAELMGLGELGIIGVNAAIANAVHHATGKRVRSLPIRLDSLL